MNYPESIRCFMLVPTDEVEVRLRRYCYRDTDSPCSIAPARSHQATGALIGKLLLPPDGRCSDGEMPVDEEIARDDPRWPSACACGYHFTADDVAQHLLTRRWRRDDTGELTTREDAPAGAMYDGWWYHEWPDLCGEDGRSIHLVTPGGLWIVDSCANNCKHPEIPHKCWRRVGTPPDLTVPRVVNVCEAGSGSIQCGPYHGFLTNGHLVTR